jgi:hypothetical protein
MLTRDEIEASLRRNLADTGVPETYHDALVDAFVTEATAAEDPPPDRRGRYWPTEKAERELGIWDRYQQQEAGR